MERMFTSRQRCSQPLDLRIKQCKRCSKQFQMPLQHQLSIHQQLLNPLENRSTLETLSREQPPYHSSARVAILCRVRHLCAGSGIPQCGFYRHLAGKTSSTSSKTALGVLNLMGNLMVQAKYCSVFLFCHHYLNAEFSNFFLMALSDNSDVSQINLQYTQYYPPAPDSSVQQHEGSISEGSPHVHTVATSILKFLQTQKEGRKPRGCFLSQESHAEWK